MSALDAEDVRRFSEATQRVHELQERLGMAGVTGVGTSSIHVNAGGVGVWLCAMCCAVMLTAALVGAFWVSREFNRVDSRFNDQTDTDSVQDAYIQKLRAEQKQQEKR